MNSISLNNLIFILYVSSQDVSRNFYREILGSDPVLDVPGMTEFKLNENTLLGLMPEKGIARIISPPAKNPSLGNGIPRCELYLYVEDPQKSYELAIRAGASGISEVQKRSWGDTAAYCSDPDGNIIAFASK